MLETIKDIGSLAGLISAAFLIWDRLVGHRPIAEIIAKVLDFGEPYPFLRVTNAAPTHIIIANIVSNDAGYQISDSDTVGGAARAAAGFASTAVISPDDHHDFPIWPLPGLDPSSRITFEIFWRKANWTWLPQPNKRVRFSPADVELMLKAAKRRAREADND